MIAKGSKGSQLGTAGWGCGPVPIKLTDYPPIPPLDDCRAVELADPVGECPPAADDERTRPVRRAHGFPLDAGVGVCFVLAS
jgi:hypothetical protein